MVSRKVDPQAIISTNAGSGEKHIVGGGTGEGGFVTVLVKFTFKLESKMLYVTGQGGFT